MLGKFTGWDLGNSRETNYSLSDWPAATQGPQKIFHHITVNHYIGTFQVIIPNRWLQWEEPKTIQN
jgi:hypothetical protein